MRAQGASWDPAAFKDTRFTANLRQTSLDSINIIESISGICEGSRDERRIAEDESEMFGLLFYKSGMEEIYFGDERYQVSAGDVFIWDSTKPTKFAVTEEIHKIACFMPLQLLRDWLPKKWQTMPRKLSGSSGSRVLLSGLLSAMSHDDFSESMVDSNSVKESIMSIIVGADNSSKESEQDLSIKLAQMQRIKVDIADHLSDSDLCIKEVAERKKISTRYIHWVFKDEPLSVSQYIISQRLEKCRRELIKASNDRSSVSQIAYSWGFNNTAHFSKRYRAMFNESPSETRARHALA